MTLGTFRFGLARQNQRLRSRHGATDDETFAVGIIQNDLTGSKHIRHQITIAQILIGCALHHVGMGGVVSLLEHWWILREPRQRAALSSSATAVAANKNAPTP